MKKQKPKYDVLSKDNDWHELRLKTHGDNYEIVDIYPNRNMAYAMRVIKNKECPQKYPIKLMYVHKLGEAEKKSNGGSTQCSLNL